MHEARTRSPSTTPATPEPMSTTVPTASCPRIVPGGVSGTSPLRMCRSVPQIVTASTRMMASRGSVIFGSSTSVHERCPGPLYTMAFMVLLPSVPEISPGLSDPGRAHLDGPGRALGRAQAAPLAVVGVDGEPESRAELGDGVVRADRVAVVALEAVAARHAAACLVQRGVGG